MPPSLLRDPTPDSDRRPVHARGAVAHASIVKEEACLGGRRSVGQQRWRWVKGWDLGAREDSSSVILVSRGTDRMGRGGPFHVKQGAAAPRSTASPGFGNESPKRTAPKGPGGASPIPVGRKPPSTHRGRTSHQGVGGPTVGPGPRKAGPGPLRSCRSGPDHHRGRTDHGSVRPIAASQHVRPVHSARPHLEHGDRLDHRAKRRAGNVDLDGVRRAEEPAQEGRTDPNELDGAEPPTCTNPLAGERGRLLARRSPSGGPARARPRRHQRNAADVHPPVDDRRPSESLLHPGRRTHGHLAPGDPMRARHPHLLLRGNGAGGLDARDRRDRHRRPGAKPPTSIPTMRTLAAPAESSRVPWSGWPLRTDRHRAKTGPRCLAEPTQTGP